MRQNGYSDENLALVSNGTPRVLADVEAEKATLGAIWLDPQRIVEVAAILKPEDFYVERNGWIFAVMLELHEAHKPLDTITVSDLLERQGRLEQIGGYLYLLDLGQFTTSLYAEHYAKIVADYATRRRLVAMAGKIANSAYDTDREVGEIVDESERAILSINALNQKRPVKHISEILPRVFDRAEEASKSTTGMAGLPTGFVMLDRVLGGLRRGDMILVGGATGMGKTAFALNVVGNIAKLLNRRVGIFSLEMSDEQLVSRLLSAESAVDGTRIINGWLEDEDWSILLAAANNLQQRGIFIDDTPSISVAELRSKARRMVAEQGVEVILIDYLQLMSSPSEARGQNREQQVAAISRNLKGLARELNVPLIILAQINQEVDQRNDKRPMMGDIRESKAPGHDADIALFVYREEYYDDSTDKQNIADILVRKNRHGAPGTVSLYWRGELTQFRDLEIQRTELDMDAPNHQERALNY